jgi:hypothetical protein
VSFPLNIKQETTSCFYDICIWHPQESIAVKIHKRLVLELCELLDFCKHIEGAYIPSAFWMEMTSSIGNAWRIGCMMETFCVIKKVKTTNRNNKKGFQVKQNVCKNQVIHEKKA